MQFRSVLLIFLLCEDLLWDLTATPHSCNSNLGSLVKARIIVGTDSSEYYGLPIDQQSRNEGKDNLVARPHLKFSVRDLGKSSWTGTDKDGYRECNANHAQVHLCLATLVVWVCG